MSERSSEIYRVTLLGSLVNLLLVITKFIAGILGTSTAMIADAVHSLSDLATDAIVLLFVKISTKPADEDHNYGHGRYETLATLVVGLSLLVVGAMLLAQGIEKILAAFAGETLTSPSWIALAAAIISIIAKELVYRITVKVGRKQNSDAVIANAWHHRSDALSSIGTGLGIGGALTLGPKWALLDPIAAAVVSIFIIVTAVRLFLRSINELLDKSLPAEVEDRILKIVAENESMQEVHHLRTRSVGNAYAIEMHVRMDGKLTLNEAHHQSVLLEDRLKAEFGPDTITNIHIEPIKINGRYELS